MEHSEQTGHSKEYKRIVHKIKITLILMFLPEPAVHFVLREFPLIHGVS